MLLTMQPPAVPRVKPGELLNVYGHTESIITRATRCYVRSQQVMHSVISAANKQLVVVDTKGPLGSLWTAHTTGVPETLVVVPDTPVGTDASLDQQCCP